MKFAVIGGDRRSCLLGALLARDGHRVQSFALEKAELPGEIPKAGCLQGCTYGADCVILPIPAESGGVLNAPYALDALPMQEVLAALWPGQLLAGGKFSEDSCAAAMKLGVQVCDIMLRRDFAVANAAITAEGAIGILLSSGERTLWKSRVLVTGWGRIGKLLSLRLRGLGAEVTVAARRSADRAMARALGLKAADYAALEGELGEFQYIVNTVPARVISGGMLCCCAEGTVLLELASPPGGFDRSLAENIGLRAISAPGLPGRSAPHTAAEHIRDAVYDAIGERED